MTPSCAFLNLRRSVPASYTPSLPAPLVSYREEAAAGERAAEQIEIRSRRQHVEVRSAAVDRRRRRVVRAAAADVGRAAGDRDGDVATDGHFAELDVRCTAVSMNRPR